jgi:propanol-preferring alcohol dehydrogenase
MRAWAVHQPGPVDRHPLVEIERPLPEPARGEVRVRVRTCGVCRTDLHVAEGDLPVHRRGVVPGHEVVGTVDALGQGVEGLALGARVGVAWLHRTCGRCRFCLRGDENLCLQPTFTGWDVDGGYAEHVLADAAFVHPIPEVFSDVEAAPLLCAGIIGYRALRRACLPEGGRLGIYGFGGSAHLAAQVALAEGATVHVLTRSAEARALALSLGCASAGATHDPPPEPLDAAIVFAPVGDLIPTALAALDRGGTVAVAGIHLTDIPALDYQRHLFQERQLRSVTANTRADAREFLSLAARIGIQVTTEPYPLDDATWALQDLARDKVNGAAVLVVDDHAG